MMKKKNMENPFAFHSPFPCSSLLRTVQMDIISERNKTPPREDHRKGTINLETDFNGRGIRRTLRPQLIDIGREEETYAHVPPT